MEVRHRSMLLPLARPTARNVVKNALSAYPRPTLTGGPPRHSLSVGPNRYLRVPRKSECDIKYTTLAY